MQATGAPSPSPLAASIPITTPIPIPSPAVSATPPPEATPAPAAPSVWEQTITLNTYGWRDALVNTTPDDEIYPYPRLNFEAVAGPTPQAYRAVYLENEYVRLVILPELGGRILRWTDRVTGRQLFYANPVIKPTGWGFRGWWLATGGMEWAFPEEEHGLNEYRPWQYRLLGNGVQVWDTDDRTGLRVQVTIQLDGAHSAFTLAPHISNPTDEPAAYQFWLNAMLTLSDANTPSPGLTFILPDDAVTVHSTADASLPDPGAQMTWPMYGGRDFSRYETWRQYLGVFADPAAAGFVGAYDLRSDQGVVRVFPHQTARGVKIFCLGDLPAHLWTDDGSRYFELWGGLTSTFWDYRTLDPGGSVGWTERWYPVSGVGGYNWANETAAIRLTPLGDRAELAVATSRPLDGQVVLRRGGVEVQRWTDPLRPLIAPDRPFQAMSEATDAGGEWGVQLLEAGVVTAQLGP